ncbi:3-keto-5-aminohexanoate cleavage protein [Clostridiales bacterium PH28_bin88]|nr:3-keto-5-aminohexanoate cleavage protein [Clostridiales bacterium PH28_bin88]
MAKKIWITAAITGGIHTPSMSPYLPQTPKQIVEDAVGAYEAGAAVVHIHARMTENGKPSAEISDIKEIVQAIKKRCNVIIGITTGGAPGMTLEQRIAPIPALKPEIASLNAGSINFVISPGADVVRKKGVKYEWEIPYLESSYDFVFANSFKVLEQYCLTMNDVCTRPEFEVYDVAMINNIAYFINRGIIKTPPYIQFVMGILGGIPATVDNLVYLVKTAREQLVDFHWSVAAAGKFQFPIIAAALAMGGNVRVGLEDNLYVRPKVLAKSSAEQVIQIKEIAERMGLEIATVEETRAILNLKGTNKTSF